MPEVVPEVVPEAEPPAEAVPGAKPAQEPGTGTMTLDGETRSFVVNWCYMSRTNLQPRRVKGDATDDAGYTLTFDFMRGFAGLQASRTAPEVASTTYRNREKPAAYQVDGTTVTLDASFEIAAISGKSSSSIPSTKTSIQLSFYCSG